MEPATQTEDETEQQEDTEPTELAQPQGPSDEQAAEASQKEEEGTMYHLKQTTNNPVVLFYLLYLVRHRSHEKLRGQ